jgi:alpha-tubulin suppressor-like RCC1 family protein
LTDAVELAAGSRHTCARRASGAVVCWGSNVSGQLGDGTTTDSGLPVVVGGLTDAVEIDSGVGTGHTCARRASGVVVCWGWNGFGGVGDGTVFDRSSPVVVPGLTDAVEISLGHDHSCARRASGAVLCWGFNLSGQVGDGTTTSRHAPVAVVGLTDAVEISAGGFRTCVRRLSGAIACWGQHAVGEGLGSESTTPVDVARP